MCSFPDHVVRVMRKYQPTLREDGSILVWGGVREDADYDVLCGGDVHSALTFLELGKTALNKLPTAWLYSVCGENRDSLSVRDRFPIDAFLEGDFICFQNARDGFTVRAPNGRAGCTGMLALLQKFSNDTKLVYRWVELWREVHPRAEDGRAEDASAV